MAAELGRMSANSNGQLQVPSAGHMQQQLGDMLEQQAAAEALQAEVRRHHHTHSMLDEEHRKLQMANAEVTTVLCHDHEICKVCHTCAFHDESKLDKQTWFLQRDGSV